MTFDYEINIQVLAHKLNKKLSIMKGKRRIKKKKSTSVEKYAPVAEWNEAPVKFRNLMLNNGESTIIIDDTRGLGLYRVARLKDTFRYCSYLDGVEFKEKLNYVSKDQLKKRAEEKERFL